MNHFKAKSEVYYFIFSSEWGKNEAYYFVFSSKMVQIRVNEVKTRYTTLFLALEWFKFKFIHNTSPPMWFICHKNMVNVVNVVTPHSMSVGRANSDVVVSKWQFAKITDPFLLSVTKVTNHLELRHLLTTLNEQFGQSLSTLNSKNFSKVLQVFWDWLHLYLNIHTLGHLHKMAHLYDTEPKFASS